MDALPPPSNAKKPEEKQDASKGENGKIEWLISALIDIAKANGDAENTERNRTRKHETRHFWLTVIEIALVAIYALFTYLEWRTFDSERQTMEAEFQGQAAAAELQLAAMTNQVWEMQKEHRLGERAWLGFESAFALNLPYDGNHNIGIQTKVVNSGKTPAMVETVHLSVGIINDPFTGTNWTTNWFLEKDFHGFTVPPNGQNPLTFFEEKPIGSDNFALLAKKQQAHLFLIKIRYRDVFGNLRHTDSPGIIITGPPDAGSTQGVIGEGRMD